VTRKGNNRRSGFPRAKDDWYVETETCVEQLLDAIDFTGFLIWDPACGQGTALDVCRRRGLDTVGSDIVDRGAAHSWRRLDFLADPPWWGEQGFEYARPVAIICNPPYGRLAKGMPRADTFAERFVRRALSGPISRVAMIIQRTLLWSERRWQLFAEDHPPTQLLFLSERPSMPPGAELPRLRAEGLDHRRGSMDYVWIYWERGAAPRPPVWLRPSNTTVISGAAGRAAVSSLKV